MFFLLVLLQLEKETVLVSSLRSVSSLVQQHYRKLEGEEEMGKDAEGEEEMGKDAEGEEEMKDKEEEEREQEEEDEKQEGVLDCGQSQRDRGGGGSDVRQTGDPRQCSWDTLTVHSAAAQTLEFARPFVEDIHQQYRSVNMVGGLCTPVAHCTIS